MRCHRTVVIGQSKIDIAIGERFDGAVSHFGRVADTLRSPHGEGDRIAKHASSVAEGVKLSVFAAGVNLGREAVDKMAVVLLADKTFVQQGGVSGGDNGLQPGIQKGLGYGTGIVAPKGFDDLDTVRS